MERGSRQNNDQEGNNGLDALVEDLKLKYKKMAYEMARKGQGEQSVVDNFLENNNLPFTDRVIRFPLPKKFKVPHFEINMDDPKEDLALAVLLKWNPRKKIPDGRIDSETINHSPTIHEQGWRVHESRRDYQCITRVQEKVESKLKFDKSIKKRGKNSKEMMKLEI